ncbi:MAG: extracellular solute-binding protein, partial [Aquiluna sp.]
MKLRSALVVVSIASLLLSGCAPQEDSLLVYSGRSEALIAPLVDEFEKETGIDVEVRYAGSAELAAQLLEEGENSPADVFLAQDAGALGAAAKAGLLKTLPDEIYSLVPAGYSAADRSWVGVSGRARVMVYDPSEVSELPESIFDLEDSSWQGRIGIAPTNASFQAFVTAMRVLHGDERTLKWLEAMKANAVIYEKNGAILEAVESGQLAELMRLRTLELLINTVGLTASVSVTALVIGGLQAWLTVRSNLPLAPVFAILATLPLA